MPVYHCDGDLLLDLLDVVGEAGAEGGVLAGDADGAGLGLDAAHGNAGGCFAGGGLVGVHLDGLRMQRWRGRGLVGESWPAWPV